MIAETTWNKKEEKRTNFKWRATPEGIELEHENDNPPYTIPWTIFHSILRHAMKMASENDNVITAGTHQSDPSPGSLGVWVLSQNFTLVPGALTPRHLSFIGPILGRMGFIKCQHKGNSIQWAFNQ
ncbi:MAG: hypothetical protein KKA54_15715 [Proteobacteria bacterium]|nr:hypothetical protein [Pseudomonadota bacterium]MBU0967819.1 hypothetical protein [Pseudomonadota bacterium]